MQNNSLSTIGCQNGILPYLEQSLSLLNLWLIHLDLDASIRTKSFNKGQINYLFNGLFLMEHSMALVTMKNGQFDEVDRHFQRCLAYSGIFGLEEKNKTTSIFTALQVYTALRQQQGFDSDALTFAEESYDLVVKAYDCVHPQV